MHEVVAVTKQTHATVQHGFIVGIRRKGDDDLVGPVRQDDPDIDTSECSGLQCQRHSIIRHEIRAGYPQSRTSITDQRRKQDAAVRRRISRAGIDDSDRLISCFSCDDLSTDRDDIPGCPVPVIEEGELDMLRC